MATDKSGPVTREQTLEGKFDFDMSYTTPHRNLGYAPIRIPLNPEVINLLSHDWSNFPDTGYVFHYGYSLQTKSIQYILSQGDFYQAVLTTLSPLVHSHLTVVKTIVIIFY